MTQPQEKARRLTASARTNHLKDSATPHITLIIVHTFNEVTEVGWRGQNGEEGTQKSMDRQKKKRIKTNTAKHPTPL